MAEEIKKFYRSRTDRVLFGVCGGLGKYFNIDPILFRLLFVLLFLMHGAGLVVYILMVVITPEESGRHDKDKGLEEEFGELAGKINDKAHEISKEIGVSGEADPDRSSRNFLAIIIILFGMFFLVREFFPLSWINTDIVWALGIIGIGLYIIFKK